MLKEFKDWQWLSEPYHTGSVKLHYPCQLRKQFRNFLCGHLFDVCDCLCVCVCEFCALCAPLKNRYFFIKWSPSQTYRGLKVFDGSYTHLKIEPALPLNCLPFFHVGNLYKGLSVTFPRLVFAVFVVICEVLLIKFSHRCCRHSVSLDCTHLEARFSSSARHLLVYEYSILPI